MQTTAKTYYWLSKETSKEHLEGKTDTKRFTFMFPPEFIASRNPKWIVIEECKAIIDSVKNDEWQEEKFKKHIALSAKAVMIMAENIALLAGYDVKKESDVSEWLKQYRMAWLEDNKESELSEIEKVFVAIDNKTSGIYTV